MKKALYILSALLLGVVSCNKTEFESIQPKEVEPTGLVAVTMKVQIPQVELFAQTKADGQRSHLPDIQDLRVAVFGTSGYPQAYALAEPIASAIGETAGSYASTNYDPEHPSDNDIYYFKVLLPVYEGEAHVHIIANGPKSIKFVDETEESIMTQMRSEKGIGAFWARIVMPDGILTQLDQNGIMQTDDEGNFIPSEGTAHLFEDLVLVRNFAEVKLLNEATNIRNITWTLVNVPKTGSVAPMAAGSYVDDYKNYTFDTNTWRMAKDGKTYDGFMFPDEGELDETRPKDKVDLEHTIYQPGFVYERTLPTEKATCILMRAQFHNGTKWDDEYTYYRMDLTEESVGGYFPIYRNYLYQMKIHKVGNRGATTVDEAMLRDSGGNVSQSTEAKKLTDISDGESRLYVEYVEKNFTSGGKKGLWVQYVPDVTKDEDEDGYADVDNTNITVKVKTMGNALVEGTPETLTPTGASSQTGYYFYEFNVNDQDENEDLVSILEVTATNYPDVVPEGKEKSTLYRDITLRVMKKMEMGLKLVPKQVAGQGSSTILEITLPEGLPESMFPMELLIEDINHSLYATGKDGSGKTITVPVKTAKSLVDGETNSFYFVRTVASYDEYKKSNVITTEFKTNKDASATTIYVANEYFKTQTVNLLNGGIYINPVETTVPFNTTSVEVEVEFGEPDGKAWMVTAGNGITSITDADGATVTGGTGNGTFILNFPANNSTTASVTRTATVRYNGTNYTVTIVQKPLEFSITPATQTVNFNTETVNVTVHAEDGKAWKATITGPNGVTEYSLSATTGTGTQTIIATLPVNQSNNARNFTVSAEMTDAEFAATAVATITQLRSLTSPATFAASGFSMNNNAYTGSATSGDTYVTISLTNASRIGNGNNAYLQLGRESRWDAYQGSITVTPAAGLKITGITITYSDNTYGSYDTSYDPAVSVSRGSYVRNGNKGTWTGSSTSAVTFTNGYRYNWGDYYFPRITSIVVTYAVAN